MGLFDWFRTGKKRDDSPTELWERQLKLEADQRALRREWENTHDSIVRTLAKIARRDARAKESSPEPEPENGIHELPAQARPMNAAEKFRLNNIRR